MKAVLRAFLGIGFVCGFALSAQAQSASGATNPWTFSTSVAGAYEGNALFVGPEGDEEFSHNVQAGIGRNWTLRRGAVNLFGSANQYFYRKSTSLNDFRYNVGGGASHAVTRRLTWNGSTTMTSGLARDAAVLTTAGLVLPSVETRTSASSSVLAYALSRQQQLNWTVSQSGVGFSSGLFKGGSQLTSVLAWSHQVGKSQAVGISQDYSRTFADGVNTNIYGIFGTWSRTAGEWTAHTSAGLRPYSIPGEGYHFTWGLSAGITKPVRPGQVLGITYDRSVTQTYGLSSGNHLLNSVSGSYGFALTRRMFTSFGASYLRSSEPVILDENSTGQTGTASLTYRLGSRVGIGFSSSIYSRTFPATERVTSYNMMTSLTYGTTWH